MQTQSFVSGLSASQAEAQGRVLGKHKGGSSGIWGRISIADAGCILTPSEVWNRSEQEKIKALRSTA